MTSNERILRTLVTVLGAWICLVVVTGYVATGNFRLTDPERLRNAGEIYAGLGDAAAIKTKLRYVAGELNRFHFWAYDRAGAVLALLVIVLVWRVGERRKLVLAMVGLVTVITAFSLVYITPELTAIGRAIDFLPRDPMPPLVKEFYAWHGVSLIGEMVKLALLLVLAVVLVRKREFPAAAAATAA